MGVFQRRLRIVVTEQPRRRRDGLALHDGDAVVAVPAVVKPDVGNLRLFPDPAPEPLEDDRRHRPARLRRGKDPSVLPGEPVQDGAGERGQPHGPGTRLAVAQEQAPLPVVGPLQRQYLGLAAAGQQQQADERRIARMPPFMRGEDVAETAKLRLRQEALPSLRR